MLRYGDVPSFEILLTQVFDSPTDYILIYVANNLQRSLMGEFFRLPVAQNT